MPKDKVKAIHHAVVIEILTDLVRDNPDSCEQNSRKADFQFKKKEQKIILLNIEDGLRNLAARPWKTEHGMQSHSHFNSRLQIDS